MSDKNITVVVRQAWEVLVFSNVGQADGKLLYDESFKNQAEALRHATRQANRHGVKHINGW